MQETMTAEGEQQPDAADVANAAAEAVATEGDDRPSDADIIAHAASIRDEQAQRPLVGSREPLSSLMDDFVGAAPALVSKCEALAKSHSHVRRMRRDGNCFFRAFLFGLLERLIGRPEACAAAKKRFGDYGKKLVEAGYQEFVFEDALELLQECIDKCAGAPGPMDESSVVTLESALCDAVTSNHLVMLLRMVASCEVSRRAEFFEPFIQGAHDCDVESFRRRFVEPMDEESDHVVMSALSEAVCCAEVTVEYLSADQAAAEAIQFKAEDAAQLDESCRVHMTMVYRPGHFDLLYPQ